MSDENRPCLTLLKRHVHIPRAVLPRPRARCVAAGGIQTEHRKLLAAPHAGAGARGRARLPRSDEFPPLRGEVGTRTRQWARSGRGAASRIARHGQRSGYAYGYGHGNRNGLARSRASLISSFFLVKALFCSTYSTSIVEEEPRAVFLHLFRGAVFLSFSAFSGRWFELFTVTFRRVQRFYVCKRRLRGQPQLSIMGQERLFFLR